MIKKLPVLACFILLQLYCAGQTALRDSLKKFTVEVLNKAVKKQHVKKICFWDFTDINKEVQPVGSYLSELMSVYADDVDSIVVVDRQHLKTILQEHQLKSEGFIDQNTIMELGKFSDVNAVVVGTVIINENARDFQLMIKVLTTNEAITASSGEQSFPLDQKVASVVGVKLDNTNNDNGAPGRGFNRPVNSNEQYNNSNNVNKECEKTTSGDYCFYNATKYDLTIEVVYNMRLAHWSEGSYTAQSSTFKLRPQESKCISGIYAGLTRTPNHFIAMVEKPGGFSAEDLDEGDFTVEKCKSKTYSIKGTLQKKQGYFGY